MADLLRGASDEDDDSPAPSRFGGGALGAIGSVASGSGTSEIDMMRVVGGNWQKYRGVWQKMRDGQPWPVSFSLAGLLFGSLWLLYRKQWGLVFLLIAGSIAIPFVDQNLSIGFNIATNVLCALLGKALIVKGAMGKAAAIRSIGYTPDEAARRLEKAGGTSTLAVGAAIVLLLIVGVVASMTMGANALRRAEAPASVVSAQA
ncbi:MAG: hypothetical protein IPL88_06865 [Rhizobiales bacterium]|nr:hypothetical protein [Hyphomicrobiales bacterium]